MGDRLMKVQLRAGKNLGLKEMVAQGYQVRGLREEG